MEKSTSQFHTGSSLIRFWQSEDFLAMFLTSTPKKPVSSRTNLIQCLSCAEFLETSDRVARYLGSELQTSNEDLQYLKTKCYPKLKKVGKNDVRSQKSRGRVEGRNA